MHWNSWIFAWCNVVLCQALGFDSTVVHTNNWTSITTLPSHSQAYAGCEVDVGNFEFDWSNEIYTHTAATIVTIINNATNVTRVSTIYASGFILPDSARGDAQTVSDVTLTTNLAGIDYTLKYPTHYLGVGRIARYTSLVTDSAGNVECVVSSAYLNRAFLEEQYASLDDMYSSMVKGCGGRLASPPMVLVPVLSLTQTETSFEQSGPSSTAVSQASPSNRIEAPTVTPTASSKAIPQPEPIVNAGPQKPTALPPRTSTVGLPPSPIAPSESRKPSGGANDNLPPPSNSGEVAGPSSQTRSATGEASQASTATPSVNSGGRVPASSTAPPLFPPVVPTEANTAYGSSVIGQPGLVAPSSSTRPSPMVANSKDSNVMVSPTRKSRESSTTVGISHVSPSSRSGPVTGSQAPTILTFGTLHLSQEKGAGYVIGNNTILPGAAPITIDGTRISLAPSASALIVGSSTIRPESAPAPAPKTLVFGGQVLVADQSGGYVYHSHTLVPGQPPITIQGKLFSLAPSASALIMGSQTFAPKPPPDLPIISVVRVTVSRTRPASDQFLIAGQTLVPGAPPISVSGQAVSLAPGESQIVIGSSTLALDSSILQASGLASLILKGFGQVGPTPTPTPTPTTLLLDSNTTAAAVFHGHARRIRGRTRAFWGGIGIAMVFCIII